MAFDSAFFLFFFFPLLFLIYFPIKNTKVRNVLLLVAGLVFYSFGRLFDLLVLLLMAGITYGAGALIAREKKPKPVMIVAVSVDVAILALFKLAERVIVTLSGADGVLRALFAQSAPVTLIAPLGISFFAFKCVSYTVDAYKDKSNAASGFWRFLLYVSFFPEIVSGPISRYNAFAAQLSEREVTLERAAQGFVRVIRGLAKKLLIAGAAGTVADAVFGFQGRLDIRLAWVGAIAYCVQLFFDFAGYSDMAVGLAAVFGFTSPENFNYPYTASSIGDFWRRWHMSLSAWLKDYVYIPLGGNRKGKYRTALNKFIVFVVCGLWHGLGLTYLIWGVWHGLLSALESLKIFDVQKWREKKVGAALSHVYTLLAVLLGFVMFRAADVSQGFSVIGAMFAGFRFTRAGTLALWEVLNFRNLFMLAVGIALSMPVADGLYKRIQSKIKWAPMARLALYAALFALCLTQLAAGGFSPFIYARF